MNQEALTGLPAAASLGVDMEGEIRHRVVADPEALAREASRLFVETVAPAVAERGWAFVALAGGSTPRRAYALLAGPSGRSVPWERLTLVAGDERNVSREHEDRNETMIRRALAGAGTDPPARWLSWEIGAIPPEDTARRMERTLREAFATPPGSVPRFDLVLLGLGEDGHTASLFPGTPALDERVRLAVSNPVPSLQAVRYTLTFPVIEESSRVVFLAAGAAKAPAVRSIFLEGTGSGLPAARAQSRRGETVWILDEDAASALPSRSG